jgi:hypothetical protein
VLGPRDFLQRWLCLDRDFRPTPDAEGCRAFRGFDIAGYAHHPYGPTSRVAKHADIVSLLVIRRLGRYLDRAAAAGRLPARLPVYSTEFGLQSNPPDPTARLSLAEQASLLNEMEERSYRVGSRLRSYAQYLLYDDPAREGSTQEQIWSGFQTGLRFAGGEAKPAYHAYQFPIVVKRSGPDSVWVWGRVRPGSGVREVELQVRRGGRFRPTGGRLKTDDAGYFEEIVVVRAPLRFVAFDSDGRRLGTSRVADLPS